MKRTGGKCKVTSHGTFRHPPPCQLPLCPAPWLCSVCPLCTAMADATAAPSETKAEPAPASAAAAAAAEGTAAATPAEVTRSLELKDKGNAFFKEKKFRMAIEAYTEAIALNPTAALFGRHHARHACAGHCRAHASTSSLRQPRICEPENRELRNGHRGCRRSPRAG